MTLLVVGAADPAEAAAADARGTGREARVFAAPAAEPPPAIAQLAGLMVELERTIEADRPQAVLLADSSDAALAAALVGLKLLVAVEALPAASEGSTANARLIAQLASTYTAAT